VSPRNSLPELPSGALRDHATEKRLNRIWRQLEGELTMQSPRPRAVLWWAPAAAVIIFALGAVVGARYRSVDGTIAPTALVAEPPSTFEPAGPAERRETLTAEREQRDPPRRVTRDARTQPPASAEVPELVAPLLQNTQPPVAVFQPAGPPEWQRLANNGSYEDASRAVDREGGFDTALSKASSAEQLMSLYEIAKSSSRPDRAGRALQRVLDQYPDDPNAPLAALFLGNLREKAGDKAGAAAAFEIYRRLSPTGEFADDALARQFELAIERGDLEAARQLADQYAKDFPNGRRLGAIKAQLAKIAGEQGAGANAGVGEADEIAEEESEEESSPPPGP
jgi:TolA-binding protein